MKRKQQYTIATAVCVLTAAFAVAQPAQNPAVALRDGIVIHPTEPRAFVMTPDGGVAAINLTSGAVEWKTDDAAKPLGLVGNRLVAQVEPRSAAARNRFEVVSLNVQNKGTVLARSRVALPSNVRVSIGESLEGTFTSTGLPTDGMLTVWWTFVPERRGGMPPDPPEEQTPRTANGEGLARVIGAIRIDPASGVMTPFNPAGTTPPVNRWIIPGNEIDARGGRQFESADGRHVLVSERVADDRVFEKYRWSIFERATRRKVGEVRTHIAFTPFVVRGNVVVFETTPFSRTRAEEEPAMLRGVSLDGGREVWKVAVREVVWRGTMPP